MELRVMSGYGARRRHVNRPSSWLAKLELETFQKLWISDRSDGCILLSFIVECSQYWSRFETPNPNVLITSGKRQNS